LIQTTSYPESESTELRLELPEQAEFTVFVRIPGWLQSAAQLSVNGRSTAVPAERRTFAAIRRVWRNNDTIQVALPFSFRTEPIDDQHRNTVALMRGPLMLVALIPRLRLDANSLRSPEALRKIPRAEQTFETTVFPEKLRFVPFYRVGDQSYTTYLEQA
jgi:uncharacterized protein